MNVQVLKSLSYTLSSDLPGNLVVMIIGEVEFVAGLPRFRAHSLLRTHCLYAGKST